MLRVRWLATVLLLSLLSGCHQPQRIPFDSPDIFRGTYEGEIDQRISSNDVAWNADASLLVMASGSRQAALQLWDPATGTPTRTLGPGTSGYRAVMTPDGRFVALASSTQEAGSLLGFVRVWDTETGELVHRLPGRTPACGGCEPSSLALSPDGRLLALVSSADDATPEGTPLYAINELSVFELATGARLHTVSGLRANGLAPSFSPDSTQLAALGDTYDAEQDLGRATAWLWELPSGAALGTYHQPTPSGRGFLDAGGWLEGPVVGFVVENRLDLIDVVSGTLLRSLVRPSGREERIDKLALSADLESTLVSYIDLSNLDQVRMETVLWRGETPAATAATDGYEVAVGFSPNSTYAVTWSNEGLALRDPETLEVQRRLINGEVVPIRLEVTPTYRDNRHYDVEGTLQFGQDELVNLTGGVDGGQEEIYVQWALPRPAILDFTFDLGDTTWDFYGTRGYGPAGEAWGGSLAELTDEGEREWTYELVFHPVR